MSAPQRIEHIRVVRRPCSSWRRVVLKEISSMVVHSARHACLRGIGEGRWHVKTIKCRRGKANDVA